MDKVYIVGVGPGSRDYLLPVALRAIQEAHVLVGAPRLLEMFRDMPDKSTIPVSGTYIQAVDLARTRRPGVRMAILVSGDPCFYSLGTTLAASLPRDEVEMIPGLGSIPLAFARLGLPWQEALFLSVHGRSIEELRKAADQSHRPAGILTGGANTPASAAQALLDMGSQDRPCWTLSNLGLDDEQIQSWTLSSLAQASVFWPSLTVTILEALR
ncbi:MAG: precorrin-6y C5,15-methyltransferase (decarboxylating) subunit CbiE [Dethiosulfovibrio peptidovorans]|nr:MAG: precorrin-6y C5,15-methyltransferase (decarboxylating) subunit CbiE [Dethiosulfovibrio peptidovorans]